MKKDTTSAIELDSSFKVVPRSRRMPRNINIGVKSSVPPQATPEPVSTLGFTLLPPRRLSKKHDKHRKLRSVIKHATLLLQPFTVAVVLTTIWYFTIFQKDRHFVKEDEGPLLAGVILMLSVVYGITINTTFESVWEKYQKIIVSVLLKDKRTFLQYRDERIPILLHLLIFSFAAPLLGITALLEYKSYVSGSVAVFTTSFVLTLFWALVVELQNPSKSLWFAERIPPEWLTIDIDEYFRLSQEHKKKKIKL